MTWFGFGLADGAALRRRRQRAQGGVRAPRGRPRLLLPRRLLGV